MISRLLRNTLAGIATIALMASASLSQAQQVFKITAIPDESPTEVARKAEPLVKFLEKVLGMKVEFTPVTDYAAAVGTLVNKKVDMAWLGGFHFCSGQRSLGWQSRTAGAA